MARKKRERKGQQQGFEPDATATRPRLTPVEIQQKVFRLAFRGYNERDVDEFLDHVTEDLAALHEENKRLREQVQEGGGASTEGAKRQAETIVREAREHAARLVEEAERRGATGGAAAVAAAAGPVPASFLVREREFLQRLASLVQGHARTLKEDARKGRPAKPAEPPVAVPAPGAEAEAPAPPPSPAGAEAAAVGSTAVIKDPDVTPVEAPTEDRAVPTQKPGPQGPRDASAAWGSVGEAPEEAGSTPTASPWTQDRAPSGEPAKDDPLLAAWESAFLGPEGQATDEAPRRKGDQKEGEPSLRELFWGEE